MLLHHFEIRLYTPMKTVVVVAGLVARAMAFRSPAMRLLSSRGAASFGAAVTASRYVAFELSSQATRQPQQWISLVCTFLCIGSVYPSVAFGARRCASARRKTLSYLASQQCHVEHE